jgi:5-methylcytosine-specific restriction endonuclease McrA
MNSYNCANCGSEFQRYPSKVTTENPCCSQECAGEYVFERMDMERHNLYKGGPALVECAWCGEELERRPCKLERSENFFCGGSECRAKWKSENVRRENHPNWKGGHRDSYGPNWDKKREERLEKDGFKCVVCRQSNEEHKEVYGVSLHVHHIERKENFRDENGDLDYDRANRLENLVTLCYKCHNRWEGIPVRPMVVK